MSITISHSTRCLYEFGQFRLDITERVLQHNGTAVSLPPKVFDTLVVLVEHHGRLLEKDELIRLLWPDSFVEEGSLARKISYLRKALEEKDPEQRYIETIPKIGYRFIAEVRVVPETSSVNSLAMIQDRPAFSANHPDESSSATDGFPTTSKALATGASTPRLLLRWQQSAAIFAGLMLVSGLVYWFISRQSSHSIPFQNPQPLLATHSGRAHRNALSPDGKYLAFVLLDEGGQSLWVQQTTTGSAVQIVPPSAIYYRSLTFSPDGNYIFYTQVERTLSLHRLPVLGGQPVKLMEEVDSPPALSPDGKQMAFVRRDSGKGESSLRLVNTDGTGERLLAVRQLPNRFSPDGLSWSPDGQHIAIGVEDHSHTHRSMRVVAVQVADGREVPVGTRQWYRVEQVTWAGNGAGVFAVAWDPVSGVFGGQLWYLPWPAGQAHRVTSDLNDYEGLSVTADNGLLATIRETRTSYFQVETAGEAAHLIPGLSAIGDTDNVHLGVAWLAGGRLVYGKTVGGNADLWAMDLDGRNQQRLTTNPEADLQPATSADGTVIVYTSFRDNHPHIWRMDADGKNQRQLTDGNDETMPAISADGQWLYYLSTGTRNGNLRKMPLSGGTPVPTGNYVVSRPALSPDGKWVAGFMADPADDERSRLMVLPVTGQSPPRVFFARAFFEQAWVQWAPDSRAIRFLDLNNGVANLRSQPLDGSPSQPLTSFQSDLILRFAWSPDGRSLVCERGKKARDIILFKTSP